MHAVGTHLCKGPEVSTSLETSGLMRDEEKAEQQEIRSERVEGPGPADLLR